MGSLNRVWPLPGRWMLAAGLAGFGLINLVFAAPLDGLDPVLPGSDTVWMARMTGSAWLAAAVLISIPRLLYAGQVVGFFLCIFLPFLHGMMFYLSRTWPSVVGWVSIFELLGIFAGLVALHPRTRESARAAPVVVGAMLILFGFVHWMYVGAISGMIPEWIPGRAVWPWVTGAANVLAGLAIASGVFARLASALVGTMFASWIFLVHLPRLLTTPGDKAEWVGLALACALTGVVWTLHRALAHSGEDLQPSAR